MNSRSSVPNGDGKQVEHPQQLLDPVVGRLLQHDHAETAVVQRVGRLAAIAAGNGGTRRIFGGGWRFSD